MQVRAAGGVLWRPGPAGPEVAVVHRPRYDDWSLPKGKLDPGEHPLQAAVREVREETGHEAVVGPGLGTSSYDVLVEGLVVPKTVQWWSLRCLRGEFTPSREVDALLWASPAQARRLLTAGRDTEVLDAFVRRGRGSRPLVLLRHARAGRRADWRGRDVLRPLDERGRRQARRLAELLALHEVTHVVTAPPLRCVQTVEPLAVALGLEVVVEPLLADAEHAARPEEAAAAVRALPPGTVACSQGDALPALLAALGARPHRLRKGAARVLWCEGGALLADDGVDPEERD